MKSLSLLLVVAAFAGLSGCGKKSTPAVIVAKVTLTSNITSIEPGQTFNLSPRATDVNGGVVPIPAFTFSISNPASPQTPPPTYVSIAALGVGTNKLFIGCAGSWDSLTNPVICTPGPAGTVQITVSAVNANSDPITVHIHQHVDQIVVAPSSSNPMACLSARNSLTVPDTENFKATAFSNGLDISNTVGTFTWTTTNSALLGTSTTASGLQFNEVQVAARLPGATQIYASVAGSLTANTTSVPLIVTVCPVQSIQVLVQGTNDTSFIVSKAVGKTLEATVFDSLGNALNNVPLTWLSSRPTVLTATGGSATGTDLKIPANVATTNVGGAAITAICAPPGCNTGLNLPPLYSNIVTGTVTGTPNTVVGFVTSTGCTGNPACTTSLWPFGQATPESTIQIGTSAVLPATPNSLIMDSGGRMIFVGSDDGLAIVNPANNPPAITVPNTSVGKVTGKVLAASADGNLAIVSNTKITPNVVWIVNVASPNTGTKVFNLDGITAAAFMPDSSKVWLAGGNKLYVYSATAPLVTLDLTAQANDITILGNSQFAYASVPTGVDPFATCANSPVATVATPGPPAAIRATADGTAVIAADSPNLDVIDATITLTGNPAAIGCPPIVSHTVTPVSLGIGSFTVRKMEVAADSHSVFLITNEYNNVLLYNLQTQSLRSIPLQGGANLLDASLSSDGNSFLVGADDGKIHYLTLQTGDLQQVTINACTGTGVTPCNPDLVVLRP